tara:strand:- start:49 stop:576 length:528 start_codon:yes stop_codon:yes gene_type:complete
MRKIIILLFILTLYACNKPKTVLICGDHVCVNKAEAEKYFEDNLTLEVQIIDNKKNQSVDLVQLNLKSDQNNKKEISLLKKDRTEKQIKVLSNSEIKEKKNELKKNKQIKKKKKVAKLKKTKSDKNQTKKNVNKSEKKIDNICVLLKECNIDEISEYLVKQGKKKGFPDITAREE